MYYNKDEIEIAKDIDLITFIQSYCGFNFDSKDGNRFTCKEHDSLIVICSGNNSGWHWNSKGLSGKNAIDFLTKVENKSFLEAMDILLDDTNTYINVYKPIVTKANTASTSIELPKRANTNKNVIAYLVNTRGIDKAIVYSLIKDNRLYMDEQKNCVFVNYDKDNKVSFYQKRGTNKNMKFICNSSGSKRPGYGYSFIGNHYPKTVLVFEAPIDMLSFANIYAIRKKDINRWKDFSMIALCGVDCLESLVYFLENNNQIKRLYFCFDNDKAGNRASEKYMNLYNSQGYICKRIVPKEKDFNDDLLKIRKEK